MNDWPETRLLFKPDNGGGDGGAGGTGGGDGGDIRTESKKHIADQIYDQLNSLFHPGGDQIFSMEYPGRVLDINSYKYDVTSPYSVLAKPQLVTEAEFRLSDDLFDIAQITGGPNGRKFSTTYESILNYLLPKLQDSQRTCIQDKARMRAWLLEQVEYDETDETTGEVKTYKCSRMQLYQKLNDRYLKAKAAWEKEKLDRLRQAETFRKQTGSRRLFALARNGSSRPGSSIGGIVLRPGRPRVLSRGADRTRIHRRQIPDGNAG